MINLNIARKSFKKYLEDFDMTDGKIELKVRHTYGVVSLSEYIAKDLGLEDEDIQLAMLIALLHDIGRFEQAKVYDDFRDYINIDHADFGAELLFKNGLIREFIDTPKFDGIIEKAIRNHNKLVIEEGLEGKELLHVQIIRDADKTDNFRVKSTDDIKDIFNSSIEEIGESKISEKIFNDFMNNRIIVSSERITDLDHWVSYLAFIFDYNFNSGLRYIQNNNFIDTIIDRIDYKLPETKDQMEKIRNHAKEYITNRLNNA